VGLPEWQLAAVRLLRNSGPDADAYTDSDTDAPAIQLPGRRAGCGLGLCERQLGAARLLWRAGLDAHADAHADANSDTNADSAAHASAIHRLPGRCAGRGLGLCERQLAAG